MQGLLKPEHLKLILGCSNIITTWSVISGFLIIIAKNFRK